ncbi:MAG: hypothetical protein LBH82_02200 [Bacteroidales bacterium]|jgi:Golgi nucleoside diphosphatase|nr:hypothetical protein [Bacteroidales bacterium]
MELREWSKNTFKVNNFFISLIICCSFSTYSQITDSVSPDLIDVQKDYLYHLSQLNTQTILSFKKPTQSDEKKLSLIEEKLNINLQVENIINIPFFIQEKCNSEAIQVNVFFFY